MMNLFVAASFLLIVACGGLLEGRFDSVTTKVIGGSEVSHQST
jgi:hypothetical protein